MKFVSVAPLTAIALNFYCCVMYSYRFAVQWQGEGFPEPPAKSGLKFF